MSIYDPVGGAPAIDALGGLATGGRLLAIGFASGPGEQPSSRHVLRRNASIVGVFVGAYDRATNEDTVARLGELATAGSIGGLVTDTFAVRPTCPTRSSASPAARSRAASSSCRGPPVDRAVHGQRPPRDASLA